MTPCVRIVVALLLVSTMQSLAYAKEFIKVSVSGFGASGVTATRTTTVCTNGACTTTNSPDIGSNQAVLGLDEFKAFCSMDGQWVPVSDTASRTIDNTGSDGYGNRSTITNTWQLNSSGALTITNTLHVVSHNKSFDLDPTGRVPIYIRDRTDDRSTAMTLDLSDLTTFIATQPPIPPNPNSYPVSPTALKSFSDSLTSHEITSWYDGTIQIVDDNVITSGGNGVASNLQIVSRQTVPDTTPIPTDCTPPIAPSVLFRERTQDQKDGTWGLLTDEIPGWDHTGFHIDNKVWESFPLDGRGNGAFVSADGKESVNITRMGGVQAQHTRATFKHDSMVPVQTYVVAVDEILIEKDLAGRMQTAIESVAGTPFQKINYSLAGLASTLAPQVQKGGNGGYTCVGLVEWSAEQAGHQGRQGFILDEFESFFADIPILGSIEIPLLSPQLLHWAMKNPSLQQDVSQWLQGLLDPVDFILKDPLGRRIGFVQGTGKFNEIPHAFYSGNGGVEQFLIPHAIPGTYTLELIGVAKNAFVAVGSNGASSGVNEFLAQDQRRVLQVKVATKLGTSGDINQDGAVNQTDIDALQSLIGTMTNAPFHPGDLDGDGALTTADVALLTKVIAALHVQSLIIDIRPFLDSNPVILRTRGIIPVAVMGSSAVDVKAIDVPTLKFGPAGASPTSLLGLPRGLFLDLNRDGFTDLVTIYRTKETGITVGLEEACIVGESKTDQPMSGCDKIRVIDKRRMSPQVQTFQCTQSSRPGDARLLCLDAEDVTEPSKGKK